MALLLVIGSVIPNPQRDIIERQIRVEKVIEKQAEKLQEKVEDNLTGDVGLTEEEKQELIELVNRLADTLRQTLDYKGGSQGNLQSRTKPGRSDKMV